MTGLTALNPGFLPLLPLAALPVLFHLFFRLQKSPRVFSTLMFFDRIDPKLNARRRLREWLILLLRSLLILLLLLALTKPVWFGIGREGSAAVALVIDNSGSMSDPGAGNRTKLKDAVDAARGLVAQLRDKDSAGIVLLVDDPIVPLPAGLTADKPALRNALDRISGTEGSGSVAAALERASALFENNAATHFEIHVLTDLQQEKWNQPPVNLRLPRAGTSIVVHRLPSLKPPKSNVSITGVRLPTLAALSGRKLPLEVQLANALAAEGRVRLSWLADSGARGSSEIIVPAKSDTTASVTLEPQNPGLRWVGFQIDGDDFDADNRAFIGFNCREKKNVIFAGTASDFGQLPLAVSPTGDGKLSGLIPSFVDRPDYFGDFLALTWGWFAVDAPARWRAFKNFLDAGGSALVVPGTRATGSIGPPPDWLAAAPGNYQSASNGLALVALDKANSAFSDLRDGKGDIALRNVKVFRFFPLRSSPNATPVLGLEDGRALLAEQKTGKGRLYVSGLAFDPAWSTLTLKPGFIALAQNLALAQTDAGTNIILLVAGEPLRLAGRAGDALQVRSLGGSPLDWKGTPAQLATLPRSGVYAAHSEKGTSYVAVRASEKEGRQTFIATEVLPALGPLAYAVKDFSGSESLVSEFRRLDKSLDLSPLLLLLALAALAAEGWLANRPPLKARPAAKRKPIFEEEHAAAR